MNRTSSAPSQTGAAGLRLFLRLWPIWLILFLGACRTYQPIESYPPLSAPRGDRTGKRSVDALQPTRDLAANQAAQPPTAAEREKIDYQPEPLALAPVVSEDGTYRFERNVPVPLGEEVVLMTDFYFPAKEGKYPVILERSPQNRGDGWFSAHRGPLFARAGFIYAVQNVRGLYGSSGFFFPFKDEAVDGRHMHRWIAAQPWFSGELGAMGTGYGAYAACLAAEDSPTLKAMILEDCPSDLFLNGGLYMDGVPLGGCLLSEINWRLQEFPSLLADLRWDDALFHLPLREVDDILGHPLAFWDECLLHPSYDYFWDSFSLAGRFDLIDTPVLHLGGWYSPDNLGGTYTNYEAMALADTLSGRSGRQMLIMGPWSRGVNSEEFLGFYDFTAASRIDADNLYQAWFNKWLKAAAEDGHLPTQPVRLFCLGSNEWIDLPELPPPDVDYQPFFLHSTGRAGMDWDEGTLTENPPVGFEEVDSFISDPRDPVLSELELGTDDQRPVERREDVLTFTTAPLEADLLMVGSTQVILYMNTTAPDTDLFVMLTDVDEYGFSRPLSMGVMRVRFRDSYQAPTPVSSAEINEYILDLSPCANRFLKGHAVRLDIMGSYFPFLTRNLNSGAAIGQDSEISQAAIYLVHDFEYPSRVVLPVLP